MCCFRHVRGVRCYGIELASMLTFGAIDVAVLHLADGTMSLTRSVLVLISLTTFWFFFVLFWLFQDVSGPENSVPSIPWRSRKVKQFIPQADAFFHTAPISGDTSSRYTVTRFSNAICLTRSMRTLADAGGRWRFHRVCFKPSFSMVFYIVVNHFMLNKVEHTLW